MQHRRPHATMLAIVSMMAKLRQPSCPYLHVVCPLQRTQCLQSSSVVPKRPGALGLVSF